MADEKVRRKMLHAAEKPVATRRALLLSPHPLGRKGGSAQKVSLLEELYNARLRIRDQLFKNLQQIESATSLILPRVHLDIRRKTVDGMSLAEILVSLDEAREYRAVADFAVSLADESSLSHEDLYALGISHFVRLVPAGSQGGWNSAETSGPMVSVSTDPRKIGLVLIDVLLDIAMFHSWPQLVEQFGGTVRLRNEFSSRKVSFAISRGLKSYYGSIKKDVGYFSLASAVREGDDFSVAASKRYEELWQLLVREVTLEQGERTVKNLLAAILRRHRRGGQFSPERLRSQLELLPPGDYVLVLAEAKPKNPKAAIRVTQIFGREKWKTNAYVIKPYAQCDRLLRDYPYITFFRFTL